MFGIMRTSITGFDMAELEDLFIKNRQWSEGVRKQDPDYFLELSKQQAPKFLWIGCSDSRVPANQIVDLPPGEVFVHRNIANVVVHTDLNCLSVVHFAVHVLRVEHIIVCGHYGCGGVKAALDGQDHGLIDNWLKHIHDVYRLHQAELDGIEDVDHRADRACELNVVEQVGHLCESSVMKHAWRKGIPVSVHGLIYRLEDGLLHDLKVSKHGPDAQGSSNVLS